jgi:hypothetical protein
MRLKDFIKNLKDIDKRNGNNLQVRMADYLPVVKAVESIDIKGKKCIIITDQK